MWAEISADIQTLIIHKTGENTMAQNFRRCKVLIDDDSNCLYLR
jgi:hypothetical protein